MYADRPDLGHGDEASGDGYRYRGRGMIQLTGKENYEMAQQELKINRGFDLVANPDLVMQNLAIGLETGFVFWHSNKLNSLADKDDFMALTRKINGGKNGVEERLKVLKRLKEYLGL